jgi:hypothetical protein
MRQEYAGRVFDIYSDGLHEGVNRDLLEKVGSAELLEPEQLDALPDSEFAFIGFTKTSEKRRYYPVCDADNTKLSMHYLENFGDSLTPFNRVLTGKTLYKAAYRHGIEPTDHVRDLAAVDIHEAYAAQDIGSLLGHEKAASTSEYALEYVVNEDTYKAFPIGTKAEIVKSASAFQDNLRRLPAPHRRQVAVKLAEACDREGLNAPIEVVKYASHNPSDAFLFHIETRKSFLQDDEERATLDKLAMLSGACDGEDLASALYVFDRNNGLDRYYDSRIPDAWASVYGFEKAASTEFNGQKIAEADLIGLIDSGSLNDVFEPDLLDQMREDPVTVYDSLPNPTKEAIASRL